MFRIAKLIASDDLSALASNEYGDIVSDSFEISIENAGNQPRISSNQTRVLIEFPVTAEAVRVHNQQGAGWKRVDKFLHFLKLMPDDAVVGNHAADLIGRNNDAGNVADAYVTDLV